MRQGDSMMTGALILFVCSALFCAAGFWFYNNADDQAMQKFVQADRARQADLKRLDELLVSNISTVGQSNVRVKAMEETIAKMRDELDVFRDQVADTREKQAKLREALAAKRPVVKLSGPIPVEFYTNPNPPASPHGKAKIPPPLPQKVDPKLVKKIKKQLSEVSK